MVMAEIDTDVPMGWAAVPSSVGKPAFDGKDYESTIGGGNGKLVEASGGEVAGYAKSDEPIVIMASGSSGGFSVGCNTTIIGVGEGFTVNGMIAVDGVSNIILRNINISGGHDGISASGTHHLWVDHCDLQKCQDGLFDMKRGADKISITWNYFHDHNKNMLMNHGQPVESDEGRLNITLHHNAFDNTVQRNPRAGYGQIQILNNYYNANSGYAISVYWNAEVVIERNYFNNVQKAILDHRGGKQGDWPGPGYVILIENYTNVPGSIMKTTTTDPERRFNIDEFYMYDWVVTKDVMTVPDVVKTGAGTGPQWGKIGAIPIPGNGFTRVSTNPTLKWTKVGSKASNKVYFGKTNPPPEKETVTGYEFKPGKLDKGTVYYWKINDGKVWKFRTEGQPVPTNYKKYKTVKNAAVKKPVSALKANIPGKSSHFIGVHDGKSLNNIYLMNGKKVINGASNPINVKKETVK
jgi:pectate lyase